MILGINAGVRACLDACQQVDGSPRAVISSLADLDETWLAPLLHQVTRECAHRVSLCDVGTIVAPLVQGMLAGKADPGVSSVLVRALSDMLMTELQLCDQASTHQVLDALIQHPPMLVLASPAPVTASAMHQGLVLSQPLASIRMHTIPSRHDKATNIRFLLLTSHLDPLAESPIRLQDAAPCLSYRADTFLDLAKMLRDECALHLLLSTHPLPIEFLDACVECGICAVHKLSNNEVARIAAEAGIHAWSEPLSAQSLSLHGLEASIGIASGMRLAHLDASTHRLALDGPLRPAIASVNVDLHRRPLSTYIIRAPSVAMGHQVRAWIKRALIYVRTAWDDETVSLIVCPGGMAIEMACWRAASEGAINQQPPMRRACLGILAAVARAPIEAALSSAPVLNPRHDFESLSAEPDGWRLVHDLELQDVIMLESAPAISERLRATVQILLQALRLDGLHRAKPGVLGVASSDDEEED